MTTARRIKTDNSAIGVVRTPANANTPRSFWSRVDQSGECWRWTGAVDVVTGYGRLQYHGRQVTAHRLAFELASGMAIPEGRLVCHACDNRPCCRPEHLWLGSHADNLRDAVKKGRMRRGEQHGGARLTPEAVLEIRRLIAAGTPGVEVAQRFGIAANTVYGIVARRNWAWL